MRMTSLPIQLSFRRAQWENIVPSFPRGSLITLFVGRTLQIFRKTTHSTSEQPNGRSYDWNYHQLSQIVIRCSLQIVTPICELKPTKCHASRGHTPLISLYGVVGNQNSSHFRPKLIPSAASAAWLTGNILVCRPMSPFSKQTLCTYTKIAVISSWNTVANMDVRTYGWSPSLRGLCQDK